MSTRFSHRKDCPICLEALSGCVDLLLCGPAVFHRACVHSWRTHNHQTQETSSSGAPSASTTMGPDSTVQYVTDLTFNEKYLSLDTNKFPLCKRILLDKKNYLKYANQKGKFESSNSIEASAKKKIQKKKRAKKQDDRRERSKK